MPRHQRCSSSELQILVWYDAAFSGCKFSKILIVHCSAGCSLLCVPQRKHFSGTKYVMVDEIRNSHAVYNEEYFLLTVVSRDILLLAFHNKNICSIYNTNVRCSLSLKKCSKARKALSGFHLWHCRNWKKCSWETMCAHDVMWHSWQSRHLKDKPIGHKLLCFCVVSSALLPLRQKMLLLAFIKLSFAKRWLRPEVPIDFDLGDFMVYLLT